MNTKSPSISSVFLGWGMAGLLVFVGFAVGLGQDIPPSVLSTGVLSLEMIEQLPDFAISSDPSVEVLKVGFYGQQNTNFREFTLYGDQRLVRVQRIDSIEPESTEVQLAFRQVQDLIRLAVLFDLVETDQGSLSSSIHEAGIAKSREWQRPGQELFLPAPPTDSPRCDFSIQLSDFAESGPRANRLVLHGLGARAERYPEIPQLRGWVLIGERLSGLVEED